MTKETWRTIRESIETILVALALAFLIRAFVVESFVVEGFSMEPSLHHGERLLVNKVVYRLRQPERGDIIVFRYPYDPRRDFIKRVVAVAGEDVMVKNGVVMVNGSPLSEPYVLHPGGPDFALRKVPEGTVFVLGDNRSGSEDSRSFGFVDLRLIKGKAFVVYWPIGSIRAVH